MKTFNVCIVGGGSTYTLGFLKSFVRLREEFPLKKLVLFDIDAERQEPIGKYGEILFKERFPELEFSYTTDVKEAYEGMDFIFMQMRAGGSHSSPDIFPFLMPTRSMVYHPGPAHT